MGSVTKEELENLAVNLKKVQDKYLNDWTGESFRKARLEDKENHENILAKGKGKCVYNEDCNETAVYNYQIFLLSPTYRGDEAYRRDD